MIKTAADVPVEAGVKSKRRRKKWKTYAKEFPAAHQAFTEHNQSQRFD